MDYKQQLNELLIGFNLSPKKIPSKYFYDKRGSELFDKICELEEYYLTRTELCILESNIDEIAEFFEDDSLLVEFGSGSSTKTRLLLNRIKKLGGYIPIDISEKHLNETAEKLSEELPELEIFPLAGDYTQPLKFPEIHNDAEKRIIFFPGSTIGNFSSDDSRRFFETVRGEIRLGDGLILGADLVKDKQILEAAYNDELNITAEFNLNILNNINKSFNADFDINKYRHEALFNKDENRIEMYLISLSDQRVNIDGNVFKIKRHEKILTEYSHKYRIEKIQEFVEDLFCIRKIWSDENEFFAVIYMEPV